MLSLKQVKQIQIMQPRHPRTHTEPGPINKNLESINTKCTNKWRMKKPAEKKRCQNQTHKHFVTRNSLKYINSWILLSNLKCHRFKKCTTILFNTKRKKNSNHYNCQLHSDSTDPKIWRKHVYLRKNEKQLVRWNELGSKNSLACDRPLKAGFLQSSTGSSSQELLRIYPGRALSHQIKPVVGSWAASTRPGHQNPDRAKGGTRTPRPHTEAAEQRWGRGVVMSWGQDPKVRTPFAYDVRKGVVLPGLAA